MINNLRNLAKYGQWKLHPQVDPTKMEPLVKRVLMEFSPSPTELLLKKRTANQLRIEYKYGDNKGFGLIVKTEEHPSHMNSYFQRYSATMLVDFIAPEERKRSLCAILEIGDAARIETIHLEGKKIEQLKLEDPEFGKYLIGRLGKRDARRL
ncbi:hypothetical protein HOD88_01280 [archaeon]|jgi:hypothetical protein|nr:hypothetical protein [archaeon]